MKLLTLIALGFLVLSTAFVRADDIEVALSFDGSGGRRLISMVPKGGLSASKSQAITAREIFVMKNLTGDKIQDGAQVRFFQEGTVWQRYENQISRSPARNAKVELTIFDLKDAGGGLFRLMTPGGGWLGPVSENNRSFQVVEDEADALLVEFIANPRRES